MATLNMPWCAWAPEIRWEDIRIDSRQKLSPHCLVAIFGPNCLLKCLPNSVSPPPQERASCSFKIAPAVSVIARQSRHNNCLAAIFAPRHQDVAFGPLGICSFPYRFSGKSRNLGPCTRQSRSQNRRFRNARNNAPNSHRAQRSKNSRFRWGLKFRSRMKFWASHPPRPYFLWGNRDVEIEIFERDQKFRSRSKISIGITLNGLTSLNKEVRPFFLSDNSIWSLPSLSKKDPLAITAFGGPEGYFSLAIIAFGAFGLIVPKHYYRLGKMGKRSLDSLI